MQFDEIRKEVKSGAFIILRRDADNYFEGVVIREELEELKARLEKFLGLPVYPSNDRLPPQIENTIKKFGGIMSGQTLYFCNVGNENVIAMLWPWQDEYHTTLKIIQHEK
jgi:hypothetical protein